MIRSRPVQISNLRRKKNRPFFEGGARVVGNEGPCREQPDLRATCWVADVEMLAERVGFDYRRLAQVSMNTTLR
jgi:hypothetical protein